jgi:RHS repeat-associated protein
MQFTGEQQDSESGLVYLRARMYDPQIGRFLQRDPFTGFVAILELTRLGGQVEATQRRFE